MGLFDLDGLTCHPLFIHLWDMGMSLYFSNCTVMLLSNACSAFFFFFNKKREMCDSVQECALSLLPDDHNDKTLQVPIFLGNFLNIGPSMSLSLAKVHLQYNLMTVGYSDSEFKFNWWAIFARIFC